MAKFFKLSRLITLFLIFDFITAIAQDPFPLNFNDEILSSAKVSISKWNGKIIACEIEVIQVEKAYQDKPYYRGKLANGGQFWIGSLVTSGYEKVGAKLRLLGYFAKVKKSDIVNKYNKDGFHLLAFAVIDLEINKLSFLPGSNEQVQEWINGKIPNGQ